MEWLWQAIVTLVVQHTAAVIVGTLTVVATVALAVVAILNYRREGRWRKEEREKAVPAPPPIVETNGVRVALNNMPAGAGKNFIARADELKRIDDAWSGGRINVLSLIAAGGVGKTSVARKWLAVMAGRGWNGAEKVFCWSFYSQGTSEKTEATGDQFLDEALEFFGPDPKPEDESAMGKGQRLARQIAAGRNILVLDGLEPLQNPPGAMEGRLKDPGVAALIECLAMANQGLCVITTRQAPSDIAEFDGGTANEIDLTYFKPAEGGAAPAAGLTSFAARAASSSTMTVSGWTARMTRRTSSGLSSEMCAVPTSTSCCAPLRRMLTLGSHRTLGSPGGTAEIAGQRDQGEQDAAAAPRTARLPRRTATIGAGEVVSSKTRKERNSILSTAPQHPRAA